MPSRDDLTAKLRSIPELDVRTDVPLAPHTRFAIGGPADFFLTSRSPEALAAGVSLLEAAATPWTALGEGSNVIVADEGYRGAIVRYTGDALRIDGDQVYAETGLTLQTLVSATIDAGLAGLHTLERIPGSVGGAVYGNAGAYGHQVDELLTETSYLEDGAVQVADNAACRFSYRESVFKSSKQRIILSCRLRMPTAAADELREQAREIRTVRDEKFPPAMRCAGSVFKNLFLADLPADAQTIVPERAVRGGKVASAFFLEQVGAKGMRRGGIHIAPYHANLIYNEDGGSAADLRSLIDELKRRVHDRFGIDVEEEVQYIG